MKKMLVGAFLGIFALAGGAVLPNYASAQDAVNWANPKDDTNLINGNQTLTWSKFLDTVKNAINWILWILATIALVMCLYGWFLMVVSGGDEKKYKKWLDILKYAAIGLAIIGLSWMIISVVFWFIWALSGDNQTRGWTINDAWTSNGGIVDSTQQ